MRILALSKNIFSFSEKLSFISQYLIYIQLHSTLDHWKLNPTVKSE